MLKKKILVAPLNWGLGHATRCIPIIKELEKHHYEPVLASDGAALLLLKKEFPALKTYELPSYNITYARKGIFFKSKIFLKAFNILQTIKAERKATQKIITTEKIDGIISDNRLGVFSKKIPSVFITHQLNVLTGNTTYITSKLHQYFIKRFAQCWVPDTEGYLNLSGRLGHFRKKTPSSTVYIGPISRFEKIASKPIYNVMVILSGPEPQRTLLESILLKEFENYQGKLLFVRGVVEENQVCEEKNNHVYYNFLSGKALEKAFNESELIVARSGYTTLMDIAKLKKSAFFIPTPGQYEQVYLAKRLARKGLAPYCKQHKFSLNKLEDVKNYRGLGSFRSVFELGSLFTLFDGK